MYEKLHQDLDLVSAEVCGHLWSLGTEKNRVCSGAPRLLIPHYPSRDTPRISEQELRFLYAHVLESHLDESYAYSVETPTCASHCFTGKGDRRISAQFDLTLHQKKDEFWQRVCNVEFKAGQPTDVWQDFYKITEDWKQDLLHPIGHYFNLLKAADAGTVPSLLFKFADAFQKVIEDSGEIAPLFITICVLGNKESHNQWACSFIINNSNSRSQYDPATKLLAGAGDELRGCGSIQNQKDYIRNVWGWNIIE